MSKLTVCDNCGIIIKKGDAKYILAMNEAKEIPDNELSPQSMESLLKQYSAGYQDVKVYELCNKCKKVLEYLFKMEKNERAEILKKSEKSFEVDGNKGDTNEKV